MFWSLLDFVEFKAPFIFSSILPLSETFLLLNSFLIFDSFLYFLFDLKSYIFLKLLSFLFQIHSWHVIIRTVLTCHFFSIPTMSYCTFFFFNFSFNTFPLIMNYSSQSHGQIDNSSHLENHCFLGKYGAKYSRINPVKFVEDSLRIGRPYHFKFFKGCLPQTLIGLFLNTLPYMEFMIKIKE